MLQTCIALERMSVCQVRVFKSRRPRLLLPGTLLSKQHRSHLYLFIGGACAAECIVEVRGQRVGTSPLPLPCEFCWGFELRLKQQAPFLPAEPFCRPSSF